MTKQKKQNIFITRLSKVLQEEGLEIEKLYKLLDISRSTVNNWRFKNKLPNPENLIQLCEKFQVSADWLLGLNEFECDGISWVVSVPPLLNSEQRRVVKLGIETFEGHIVSQMSTPQILHTLNQERPFLRDAINIALRQRALYLTDVKRDETREDKLTKLFPGTEVVVANLHYYYDGTQIRSEMVSFLAARDVFDKMPQPKAIGLSCGYTLMRTIEMATVDRFPGVKWVPLMTFPHDSINHLSSNYLAELLANRHPGSEAIYLPHLYATSAKSIKQQFEKVVYEAERLDHAFITVNSLKSRDKEPAHMENNTEQLRSVDGNLHPLWDVSKMLGPEKIDSFRGELLGMLLDEHAQPIEPNSKVIDIPSEIKIRVLKNIIGRGGRVWLLAARDYKAEPAYIALKSGLVNGLVIDSEIAEYMINRESPN